MEKVYRTLNLYRSRQYDRCIELCNIVLEEGDDLLVRNVRMQAMTVQAKIAGSHYDEVEYEVPDAEAPASATAAVASTPRAGTALRPRSTNTGQILRGTLPPGTSSRARTGGTARTALATAAYASRAATVTATAVASATSTANATQPNPSDRSRPDAPSKQLFEYTFYCEGEIRKAMEMAFKAIKTDESQDWWWKFSLAKCYFALGMKRNSEDCLRQALKHQKHLSLYLKLISVYISLNQPISALDVCRVGLKFFYDDTSLKLEEARIQEAMGNTLLAVKEYRNVARNDATNMEAIANIAVYNFYNDQPEIALRYYRRLLATTPVCAELYNNIGLCCLYSNQWDLTLTCFQHALFLSTTPETKGEIWYNLAHVTLVAGDLGLAMQCLQACLSVQSNHQAALSTLFQIKKHVKNYNS